MVSDSFPASVDISVAEDTAVVEVPFSEIVPTVVSDSVPASVAVSVLGDTADVKVPISEIITDVV